MFRMRGGGETTDIINTVLNYLMFIVCLIVLVILIYSVVKLAKGNKDLCNSK